MNEHQPGKLKVSVTLFEAVVSGGVRKVTWRIHSPDLDDWISVFDHPGAEPEDLDRTPGVVWQKRVHLSVDAGWLFLRLESRPRPRERRDMMSYLEGTRNNSKDQTIRVEFCVNPQGRLVRQSTGNSR